MLALYGAASAEFHVSSLLWSGRDLTGKNVSI